MGTQQTQRPMKYSALPFVSSSNWSVSPTNDRAQACEDGRNYAAYVAQYLKENPFWVGSNILSGIVADMDFSDVSAAAGYRAGFFAELERMINDHASKTDIFANVQRVNATYAKLNAIRKVESKEAV